eukprot:COSAG06_NODE_2306_length_7110_cov_99.335188_1_plen_73_part_10
MHGGLAVCAGDVIIIRSRSTDALFRRLAILLYGSDFGGLAMQLPPSAAAEPAAAGAAEPPPAAPAPAAAGAVA